MPKTTLQAPGKPEPIVLEWQIDANGLFSVVLPETDALCEGKLTVIAPGEGWLAVNGNILPFYMTKNADTLTIWLEGQVYALALKTPGVRRNEAAAATQAPQAEIKAPMPGSIVKVAVQPGERVTIHQPLVILESMKMEMTLSAHADATVRAVRCSEGQLVALGDVLVELEP